MDDDGYVGAKALDGAKSTAARRRMERSMVLEDGFGDGPFHVVVRRCQSISCTKRPKGRMLNIVRRETIPTMHMFQQYVLPALLIATIQAFTPTNTHLAIHPTTSSSSTALNSIAVAGATGRTGKHVVSSLLSQNIPVCALVRDTDKAAQLFDPTNELLTIRKTDLGSEEDVIQAITEGECEAAIWCATGFSDAPDRGIWSKVGFLIVLVYVSFHICFY